MDKLRSFIKSMIEIPERDLDFALTCFQAVHVKKDGYVLREKQMATKYYFIETGAVRIWYKKDDKPITAWLLREADFFSEMASLKLGLPARFNYQAIVDTTLYAIDKVAMDDLYSRCPSWERFGRLVWESVFLKIVDGFVSFQTLTAEERYLAAMQQSSLLQHLPLKELATYLGVTPTSLSRIRRNLT